VDPGSSASLVDDPRGALTRFQAWTGIELAHLSAAATYTESEVEAKRVALAAEALSDDLSIVLFGSWARSELTGGSDNDWAVLVARPFDTYDADVVSAIALAQPHLDEEGKNPGAQAVFGVSVPRRWTRRSRRARRGHKSKPHTPDAAAARITRAVRLDPRRVPSTRPRSLSQARGDGQPPTPVPAQ